MDNMDLTKRLRRAPTAEALAEAIAAAKQIYPPFDPQAYDSFPPGTLESVVRLGIEVAKTDGWAAMSLFKASPEILKYGLGTLEEVVKLGIKVAETDGVAAVSLFKVSPEILQQYATLGLLGKFKSIAELGIEVAKIDTNGWAAMSLFRASPKILQLFGRYSDGVLDYLTRRMPVREIQFLSQRKTLAGLNSYLGQTDFGSEIGNKKAGRLLDIVRISDMYAQIFDNEFNYSVLDKTEPAAVAKLLEQRLLEQVQKDHGVKTDVGRIGRFREYLPYLKETDAQNGFAGIVKQILDGNAPKASGFEVEVKSEVALDLHNIHSELERLVSLYNKTTEQSVQLKGCSTLEAYAGFAHQLYDGLKQWKGQNAESINKDVKEIEPNLKRLADLRNAGQRTYRISFAPRDYEGQLEALARVPSCLSPGSSNFKYSKHYLADTVTEKTGGVFFAVIKDESDRIVGRATIAQGTDTSGELVVARASRIYPESVGITTEAFNRAIEQYANSLGGSYLPSGEMTVPGIRTTVYDDFMSSAGEDSIKITA